MSWGKHSKQIDAVRREREAARSKAIAEIKAKPLSELTSEEAHAIHHEFITALGVPGKYNADKRQYQKDCTTLLILQEEVCDAGMTAYFEEKEQAANLSYFIVAQKLQSGTMQPDIDDAKNLIKAKVQQDISSRGRQELNDIRATFTPKELNIRASILKNGWELLQHEQQQKERPLAKGLANDMEKAILKVLLERRYPELAQKERG